MAKDIKLDFTNGLLLNDVVDSKDRIIQQIKLALRIIKGEWELDTNYGLSIFSEESADTIAQEAREMISQVQGVILVKSLTVEEVFDSNGKGEVDIDAIIQLDSDIIRLSELFGEREVQEEITYDNYYLITHDYKDLVTHDGKLLVWK